MRTLKLTMHLSVDDLYHRYRDATDPVVRSHWHILWLVAQGRPGKEVAHLTGYSDTWIYWAPQGERPHVTVQQRSQWRYLYGFVCPQTGETFWLILPRVSVEIFRQALAELAQFLGLGPDRHLILVMDQAGW